jgi:6-phosphogluconolactonase
MAWTWTTHADPAALAGALAAALEDVLVSALAGGGSASLALAGGGTPLPAYRALAARPLRWSAVTALPTDERWVAHTSPACNLASLRAAFADARGLAFRTLTPAQPQGAPDAAVALANLAAVPGAFDAVLLGMGGDGHIASLFPGAAQLGQALDRLHPPPALVVEPRPLPPDAPWPRISLGLHRLLDTRLLLLAVTGGGKRLVLEQAMVHGDPLLHPVAAVLHDAGVTVAIHWSP